MRNPRSLTVSHRIPRMLPCQHTCPLPGTMHAPPAPCMPPSTMHAPGTTHTAPAPCTPPGTKHAPPQHHAPPGTMHAPRTMHATPHHHACPHPAPCMPTPSPSGQTVSKYRQRVFHSGGNIPVLIHHDTLRCYMCHIMYHTSR